MGRADGQNRGADKYRWLVWVLAVAALSAVFVSPAAASAISPITVDTTADSGEGSLRAAIAYANGNPNTTIKFAIPGSGLHTIAPVTPLPSLQQPTTIDGTSEPGYTYYPLIRLDGSAPGNAGASGLVLSTGDAIKALELTNWSIGIAMPSSNGGNVIVSSYLGTDGGTALPNGTGISITGPTEPGDGDTIGGTASTADRNLISGNSGDGIVLSGNQVQANVIEGNEIGTTAAFEPLGNRGDGVLIDDGAHDNTIGGESGPQPMGDCFEPTTCNLIANNGSHGVVVDGAATVGNEIEANEIDDNAAPDILLTNGGNAGEAAPVITSVTPLGGMISGTVSPGTHLIELFENDGCTDPTDEFFLGSVVTSSTSWSIPGEGLYAFQGLVATSTSTSTSNTSEYSACVSVPAIDCSGVVAGTEAATNITSSAATLNGTVDSPCGPPQIYFQYGLTSAYGQDVFPSFLASSRAPPEHFTASGPITGLAPDTTYHFRIVGTDLLACRPIAGGGHCNTSYGADMTFTTAPIPPVLKIAGSRADVTRAFRAKIAVSCPSGAAPCQGTIRLARHHRVLAEANFLISGGTRTTLRVKLNRSGRELMRKHRRLRVQVSQPATNAANKSILLVRPLHVHS